MLSNRQQIARLRHLAGQALGAYPWLIRSCGLSLTARTPRSGSMRWSPTVLIVFCSGYTARHGTAAPRLRGRGRFRTGLADGATGRTGLLALRPRGRWNLRP